MPDYFSAKILVHPADFNSAPCASNDWPSVDTRAYPSISPVAFGAIIVRPPPWRRPKLFGVRDVGGRHHDGQHVGPGIDRGDPRALSVVEHRGYGLIQRIDERGHVIGGVPRDDAMLVFRRRFHPPFRI